jgi:hypothetical protein
LTLGVREHESQLWLAASRRTTRLALNGSPPPDSQSVRGGASTERISSLLRCDNSGPAPKRYRSCNSRRRRRDHPPPPSCAKPMAHMRHEDAMTAVAPEAAGRGMRGLQGKNVLITGGASGIGHAIAVRLPATGQTSRSTTYALWRTQRRPRRRCTLASRASGRPAFATCSSAATCPRRRTSSPCH